MNKRIILIFSIAFFWIGPLRAQDRPISLQEALAYAEAHHPNLIKAGYEIEIARKKVQETTAIGLPQVNGNVSFQNNIELPVFIFPNPATGEQTAFRVGQKFSNSASVNVSQLLFDGQYFLGLKAAEKYVDLSVKMKDLSARDVKLQVAQSYFLALMTEEQSRLLKANLTTIQETLRQTSILQEQGFAENLDVDRLKLSAFNLTTSIGKLEEQSQAVLRMLAFSMGLEDASNLVLSDSLPGLFAQMNPGVPEASLNLNDREEFRLLQAQQTLNLLDKKRIQVSRYPSIGAFYNYQQNNFSDEFKLDPWFRTQLWGMNLRVPIFTSGSTRSVIAQKELLIKQTQQDIELFSRSASMELENAKGKFRYANQELELQRNNLQLAENILNTTLIKFSTGTGSNLEVISAQQELRNAQTNYLNAVYDALMAYTEIQKALGQL